MMKNSNIKQMVAQIDETKIKSGPKHILKLHADLVYASTRYVRNIVSPELFQTFVNLNLEEEYILGESLDLKTREAIFAVLKPRAEKLIKLAIDAKFKNDLPNIELPPEAEELLQNTYYLASNTVKNKINSKTFRKDTYTQFLDQYMDFVRVEMDLIYQQHSFGMNFLGNAGRLRGVLKFIIQKLLLRYVDEEWVTDAYTDLLFDRLATAYQDSHERKQRDIQSNDKPNRASQRKIESPMPSDTETEKLSLPIEQLRHVNIMLEHIDEDAHKRFVKYMTKMYYQKDQLRLWHLIRMYMPHIQSDDILPRYQKAIDELGFVEDSSLQNGTSGVVKKAMKAIKATLSSKSKNEAQDQGVGATEVVVSSTLKDVIERGPQALTPEILVQIFKEMGYRFRDEKNFVKDSYRYLINVSIQTELLKRLQKDESNMWLNKHGIRKGSKYERIGLDGQKLKLVKQKNTLLRFTNMSDYTNKVNEYFSDKGRDFDKEMGPRDRAAAQQQYKNNATQ